MNFLSKMKSSNKGQGVMEYIIISSLVGIFCLAAVKGFGEVVDRRVEEMTKQIGHYVKLK